MNALSSVVSRPAALCGRSSSHMQGCVTYATPFIGSRVARGHKLSLGSKVSVAAPVEISPEERPVFEVRR